MSQKEKQKQQQQQQKYIWTIQWKSINFVLVSVGSEKLLIFKRVESEVENAVAQSCLTLWDPMDCSLPGSSFHRICQARILEWIAVSFSRKSSWPRDWIWPSCIVGRHFTVWATRKSIKGLNYHQFDFQINFLLVTLEGPPMWITFLRFLALSFQLGLPNQKQGLLSWLRLKNLLTM